MTAAVIHIKCVLAKPTTTKKTISIECARAIVIGGRNNFTIYHILIIVAACVLFGSVAVVAPTLMLLLLERFYAARKGLDYLNVTNTVFGVISDRFLESVLFRV